jgi:hypothetical protein
MPSCVSWRTRRLARTEAAELLARGVAATPDSPTPARAASPEPVARHSAAELERWEGPVPTPPEA